MDASTTLAPGNMAVPPLTAPVCNANGAEGRVPMIVHPGNGDSGVVKAEVAEVEGGGRSGGGVVEEVEVELDAVASGWRLELDATIV